MARFESPRYQTPIGKEVWWTEGNVFSQEPGHREGALPLRETLAHYLLFKASVLECEAAGYTDTQEHLIMPGETPDVHAFVHRAVESMEVHYPAELLQLARDHGDRLIGGEQPTGSDEGLQQFVERVKYNREYHLRHL